MLLRSRNLRPRRIGALAAVVAGAVAPLLAGAFEPASAEVRPICFPVLDPVSYTRSFGAPRSGHTHEGTDIMGQKQHRLVSAVDGVIVDLRYSGSGTGADNGVRIRGDDGWYYAYLHMNNDTPGTDDGVAPFDQVFAPGLATGQRVSAGQFLGYMGDSGNAEATGPHLHFEIRQPAARVWDSVAVDSYDSLQAARQCRAVTSPTHPFTGLGGTITSAPDAASTAAGSLDVFARGLDGALYQRAWVGAEGRFTPWASLGGYTKTGPAAVSPASGRVDVFIRGADDALWTRTRTGSTWSAWQSLGGIVASDPDATSSGGGQITVSVRGVDDALWVRQFDGTTWGPWTGGGGVLRSGPAIGSTGPGRLDVFVRGLDDAMWHRTMVDGAWGEWATLGGVIDVDPDVAVEDGALHIVVRGTDGRLYCLPYSDGGTWTPVSTNAVGGSATVTSWGPNRLDVFVAGTDGALYQTWWNGTGW